jgi:catechol-2,3-dioxygenase
MSTTNPNYPIFELRVALTTRDYERSVKFYTEGLGIEPAQIWDNDQGQALILNMGKATLEIFDETQAETIDEIEAGQRISGQIRFALQVPDLKTAMERLLAHLSLRRGAIIMCGSRTPTACKLRCFRPLMIVSKMAKGDRVCSK